MRVLGGLILRLIALSAAVSLYAFSVSGGIINGSEIVDYVVGYAPAYFAMLWVCEDSRQSRFWPSHHYGIYVWLLWFILVPHYFLRTRGWPGLPAAIGFSLLLWTPVLSAIAGWSFYEDLPDFW